MENTPIEPLDGNSYSSAPNDTGLNITPRAAFYLQETSKWTTFLSIMGFIMIGLIVIVALFAGTFMSTMAPNQDLPNGFGFLITLVYLLLGLLYFFPTLYLYKFTQKLKSALESRDSQDLILAFENQKSLYKFWGIFTIVIIGIYAVVFVVAIGASML
jgi:hypothetical protein